MLEVPPSPAPSSLTVKRRESVRMKRMQLILKKALEVSVHSASLVDLRACLESECRGDEELLGAFFPPTPESLEQHNTEEVAAQAVMSLRQKVETIFQWLCETHDVETELLELEDVIRQAEDRRLHQVEKKQREEEKEENQMEKEKEKDKTTPEAWIRAERLRAKQEEKKELERLVEALETKNKDLQRVVEEKRRHATADVQRMQRAAIQLGQMSHLAKDYAITP